MKKQKKKPIFTVKNTKNKKVKLLGPDGRKITNCVRYDPNTRVATLLAVVTLQDHKGKKTAKVAASGMLDTTRWIPTVEVQLQGSRIVVDGVTY